MIDGLDIFDPAQPFWNGTVPPILPITQIPASNSQRNSKKISCQKDFGR